MTDFHAFIRDRLPLAELASLPPLALHRASPASGLGRLLDSLDEESQPPYWAYVWAGGAALARYVLEQPDSVRGKSVFDLGSGSGLVAIAAAKAGARQSQASEIDPRGVAAIGLNAAANNVSISVTPGDVTDAAPPVADIIMAGDLFYDPDVAKRVLAYLDRCLDAGLDVLIGDPGRAFLPLHRLRKLAEYDVTDFGLLNAETVRSAVFRLEAVA